MRGENKRDNVCVGVGKWQEKRDSQCDRMNTSLFQHLAIYNKKHRPKDLEIYQGRLKLMSNT